MPKTANLYTYLIPGLSDEVLRPGDHGSGARLIRFFRKLPIEMQAHWSSPSSTSRLRKDRN
eukprot:2719041-Rhodomonas_salina.1